MLVVFSLCGYVYRVSDELSYELPSEIIINEDVYFSDEGVEVCRTFLDEFIQCNPPNLDFFKQYTIDRGKMLISIDTKELIGDFDNQIEVVFRYYDYNTHSNFSKKTTKKFIIDNYTVTEEDGKYEYIFNFTKILVDINIDEVDFDSFEIKYRINSEVMLPIDYKFIFKKDN